MQIKPLVALVLLLAFTNALPGQNAQTIAEEFQSKAKTACEKLNATLIREGTAIAAILAAAGDSDGAAAISQQIDTKIRGEVVAKPHPKMARLMIQYDSARSALLAPIQQASIQRIDALLKSAAGKDMKSILELAKAREQIEGGKFVTAAESAPSIPMKWNYFSSPTMQAINGELVLNKDGTLVLLGMNIKGEVKVSTPGTWKETPTPNVYAVTLTEGPNPERCTMRVNGSTAELDRTVGIRYLKAQ